MSIWAFSGYRTMSWFPGTATICCWVSPSASRRELNSLSAAVLAETRPDSRCWLFDPCGTYHPISSSHQFLLCERERVKKGLHRDLAEAPAALMRPLLVVVDEPGIEIGLQFLDRAIDLFTERHPIELVEQRAMEALADPVGLWALGLCAAVIDVLDRQVELVLVAFPAAELGAAIGQHPAQPDAVLIVERHHPIVEDLGGGDWRLSVIELGEGHLGVGIDKGLLINPPDALQRANVEGVLRAAIARALALELAMRFLIGLGFLERGDLRLGQQDAILCRLGFERFEALLHRGQVVALPHAAHTGGRDRQPAPLQRLRDAHLAPGRLFDRH